MAEYFALNYAGEPFGLYGTGHLIALGLVVVLCLSFLYFKNIWNEEQRKTFRISIAIILFLNEIA
jgi:hypothetical protein